MRRICVLVVMLLGLIPLAAAQTPPQPINPGQPVQGQIDNVQRAVQYIFDAPAGTSVTLLMQTTSGDLNAFLELETFEGLPIATDDDSGGGTDALITATLENTGSYVITASSSRAVPGGAGTFTLTLTVGAGSIPTAPTVLEVGERLQPIVRGTPVRGALTTEESFVLYWFEGATGQNVTVIPDTGTNLQPLVLLYNASFTELARSQPGSPLSAALPTDSLYFLSVVLPDAQSSGGNYAITLTDQNSQAPREVQPGQTTITYGENVQGTISTDVTLYSFKFSGTSGDTVNIAMSRVGGDLDSYLYLLTAGGVTVAEDDNSGSGNGDASVSAVLPSSGDYLILATRLNQDAGTTTGSFILSLQSDSQPVPTLAPTPNGETLNGLPPISLGQSVTSQVSDEDFIDVYGFVAQADDAIEITMEATSGNLDPYLLLLDANQTVLTENDDIIEGENQNSQIRYIIETAGNYAIVATRFDQENGATSGDYSLTLVRQGEELQTNSTSTPTAGSYAQRLSATPVSSGETPQGAFEVGRFASVYTFTTTGPNRLIDFSVTTDNSSAVTVILTDSRLQFLASADDGALLGVPLEESGEYLVFVAPANGQATTQGYIAAFNAPGEGLVTETATAEATTEAVEVLPIAYGESVTGTIDNEVNVREYTFTGTANDIVRIRMNALSGSNLDPLVELVDANGRTLGSNDDIDPGVIRDSLLQVTLTADGQYTIRATHYIPEDGSPASEGEYELVLDTVSASAAGVSAVVLPIRAGETVQNEINDEQTLLFYSFTASTGDVVTIEVSEVTGGLDAVLYLYGYTSGGSPIELKSNDDSPRGNTFDPLIEAYAIPRSGTYLIAVGRYPGTDTPTSGEFSMSLRVQPAGQ